MNTLSLFSKFIQQIPDQYNYTPYDGDDLEHTLLKTFVGTLRTTRLGSIPTSQTNNELLKRINEKVKKNKPLEVTSAWGAIKTVPTKNRGVDFVEFLTIKQFSAIANTIKKIYSPGIRFNIFLGDSYYEYLYGADKRIEDYCQGMKCLAKGREEIQVVRLSNLCGESSIVINQCKENYKLLKRYWNDTADLPATMHINTTAHHDLCSLGWVGIIAPAMREFYLKRMKTLYPEESYEFWVDKIIHFFSYGLMISQNDLMGRKNIETCTVDACLLRVPPPDLPRELYSNRVRMRIAPESIVKSSAPPWTVAGVLSYHESKPEISLLDTSAYLEIAKNVISNGSIITHLDLETLNILNKVI